MDIRFFAGLVAGGTAMLAASKILVNKRCNKHNRYVDEMYERTDRLVEKGIEGKR